MNSSRLPTTFRMSEVDKILNCIKSGESSSIVGIGSVGKSNLLRFLQQEDVLRAKLGDGWNKYLFIYVDVNKLLEESAWGLFELLLHQLFVELSQREVDQKILQEIDELHQRASEPTTQHLALRYLDRAVMITCRRLGFRLTFLIDEFDELARSLPPKTFNALRALRDDHKYQLVYVVATRSDLHRLREEKAEIEAFEELVTPNTIYLVSYSEEDACFMLHRLAERYKVELNDKSVREVISVTGGHPGLIRAVFPLMVTEQIANLEDLASNRRVQDECLRMWQSLSKDEQKALTLLANGNQTWQPSMETTEQLRLKGMVRSTPSAPEAIFAPLFAKYIQKDKPIVGARIYVDRKQRIILLDGRKVEGLAHLEYELLELLDRRRGQPVSRDEIATHLYPEDKQLNGISNSRIDAVVKRLRRTIETDVDQPKYIQNVRGFGYRLVDGEAPVEQGNDN